MDNWIPWEHDSEEFQVYKRTSALETLAVGFPMESAFREFPGTALPTVQVKKFGRMDLVPEASEGFMRWSMLEFARNAAVLMDNFYLGFSGRANFQGTYEEGRTRPLMSVVGQPDSLYNKCGRPFLMTSQRPAHTLVEGLIDYAREQGSRPGIIAHPAFRKKMDWALPGGRPEIPVFYTKGAMHSSEPSADPRGNPLMFIGDMTDLALGNRSGPESLYIEYDDAWAEKYRNGSLSFLGTPYEELEGHEKQEMDDFLSTWIGSAGIKSRIRKAFTVREDHCFSCVELVG